MTWSLIGNLAGGTLTLDGIADAFRPEPPQDVAWERDPNGVFTWRAAWSFDPAGIVPLRWLVLVDGAIAEFPLSPDLNGVSARPDRPVVVELMSVGGISTSAPVTRTLLFDDVPTLDRSDVTVTIVNGVSVEVEWQGDAPGECILQAGALNPPGSRSYEVMLSLSGPGPSASFAYVGLDLDPDQPVWIVTLDPDASVPVPTGVLTVTPGVRIDPPTGD